MQAYHFFLLAQRQMYEGAIDAAMKTVRIKERRYFLAFLEGMFYLLESYVAFDF